MTTTIPVRELRNNYGQIIERVRGGEHVTVLVGGEAVADLIPHVADTAPPRFRAAANQPRWTPLSDGQGEAWWNEIHEAEGIDQAPRDPWVRSGGRKGGGNR